MRIEDNKIKMLSYHTEESDIRIASIFPCIFLLASTGHRGEGTGTYSIMLCSSDT